MHIWSFTSQEQCSPEFNLLAGEDAGAASKKALRYLRRRYSKQSWSQRRVGSMLLRRLQYVGVVHAK